MGIFFSGILVTVVFLPRRKVTIASDISAFPNRNISSENFVKINFDKIFNKGANNSLLAGKQIYLSISLNDYDEEAKTAPFYLESYENFIKNRELRPADY